MAGSIPLRSGRALRQTEQVKRLIRPAIYGHRGGCEGRPNSVESIRLAAAAGADGVEIDVQLSPDGRLVAQHDLVRQGEFFEGDKLGDILAAVEETGLKLLIDFKSGRRPREEAVALVEGLRNFVRHDLIMVSSFAIPFLHELASLAPHLDLVPIVSLRQNFPRVPNVDRWAGVSVLAVALLAHPLLLMRLRRGGPKLLVWFGFTEWPPLIAIVTWLGADVLIVKQTPRFSPLRR